MDIRQRAKELLLSNYAQTGGKYIAPDRYHKDQWLWDSCFHAIACVELGLIDLAKNEIEGPLKWQGANGFIAHQFYGKNRGIKPDIERWLYKGEHRRFHSSITNPPVLAQAVEAINDPEWTQKVLPGLIKFYFYFSQTRDPDADGLISVCLPTESGRDTSPDFNFCENFHSLWFLLSLWKLEWQYKKLNWDMGKIWQKDLFNVEDIMFNCIWIDGLKSLYRLVMAYGYEGMVQNQDIRGLAEKIKSMADNSEKSIYQLCWDEKDKTFYNLDSQNKKIRRLTISSLFPLILDNIPAEMRKALVELHLTNPKEFWTPYPVPSVAQNDPAFDPENGFFCNWRGPVWVNMNWFIVRGLVKHGYYEIARQICQKTETMIEKEDFREFYSPFSGQGLREPSRGFGWSTLVVTFPKILTENKRPD